MYKDISFEIKGVSPLLLHNGQLANPLNEIVKEIKKFSKKRSKTEADYAALSRLEWLGSLYLKDGKIVLPGEMVEALLINGAKKKRQGTNAKIAIFVEKESLLKYDGPTDIEELYLDENFRLVAGVKVSRARIMRTRPMFKEWGANIIVTYDNEVVDKQNVVEYMVIAGKQVGLGDWRPKFGRFEVISFE